mmetsp:Transcript_13156/g.27845  ORF Transcript_13156/g.27845 Transcript_13156/m.27845 type:complete len:85 (-) Transcript_13156:35-289(-)
MRKNRHQCASDGMAWDGMGSSCRVVQSTLARVFHNSSSILCVELKALDKQQFGWKPLCLVWKTIHPSRIDSSFTDCIRSLFFVR